MDPPEERMLPEPVEQALAAQARAFYGADARFEETLFAHYTIDEGVLPGMRIAKTAIMAHPLAHPSSLHVDRISSGKFQKVDSILHGPAPGTVEMGFWVKNLPDAMYLVVGAPCIGKDAAPARQAITMVVGLLVAFLGRAVTLTSIGEHTIDAKSRSVSVNATVPRTTEIEDRASFRDGTILTEVLQAINSAAPEPAAKVIFATEIFGRATQEQDETFRFLLYWVSLEVLTNTKSDGVATKLARAYGKSKNYAYDDLLFRRSSELRHSIAHKGSTAALDGRMERVMQCYFLDLLRAELKLSCRRLTQGLLDDLTRMDEARKGP